MSRLSGFVYSLFGKNGPRSETMADDGGYYPNFFDSGESPDFSEPKTFANFELRTGQQNRRQNHLYNHHRTQLQNQWINPVQGVNSGLGTANMTFFKYQPVNYVECGVVAQDPMMNNIVDILTETPLTAGGTLKLYDRDGHLISGRDDVIDYIQTVLFRKYELRKYLEAALRSSFIFGGCSIYMDFGQEYLEQPLDLKSIDGGSFRGFRVIDPIVTAAVEVNSWNPASPDYMQPQKWYIQNLGIVHHSHLIHFEWNTPPLQMKPMTMYYGMPLTQLLKQDIANVNLVSQGLANLVNKIRRTYIKMDKQMFASGNVQAVKNRLRLMQEVENNFTIFPIDVSEDIIQLSTTLTGIDNTIESFMNIIAAKTGIPRNKLLGAGSSHFYEGVNHSESERNFISKIETIRENLLKPNLEKMLQVVAKSAYNEYFDVEYTFLPLFNLSDKENSDLVNKNMDAALKLRQLGVPSSKCVDWLKQQTVNNLKTIDYVPDDSTEAAHENY